MADHKALEYVVDLERQRAAAEHQVERSARALAGARENEKHERQRADEHAATIVELRERLAKLEAAAEADERMYKAQITEFERELAECTRERDGFEVEPEPEPEVERARR